MSRKLEIDREQIKKLVTKGFSDYQIAKFLHCSNNSVLYIRRELQLPVRIASILPKATDLIIKEMSDTEIALKLDLSPEELDFLKSLLYKKICEDCNSTFLTFYKARSCCYKCKHKHTREYFSITYLRSDFYKLSQTSPQAALEIQQEMLETEGPEFTELALDGMTKRLELEQNTIVQLFGCFMNIVDYDIDREQEMILSQERKYQEERKPRELMTIPSLRELVLRKILKNNNIDEIMREIIIKDYNRAMIVALKEKKKQSMTPLQRSGLRVKQIQTAMEGKQ